MAHEAHTSSHYSRMPGTQRAIPSSAAPSATRAQSTLERLLFLVFGGMLALGAFALYATSTAAHNDVQSRFAAGLAADRLNVLLITTETQQRYGRPVVAASSVSLIAIRPSTREASLIGLPLHLWADLGKHGHRPLGAAFEVGNAAGSPGGGDGLTITAVERVTGVSVHAYARVTTSDLAHLIDRIGGITVDVPHGVYEVRHEARFPLGRHQLDGARAVLYGFSREVALPARDLTRREERRQAVVASTLQRLITAAPQGLQLPVDTNLTPEEAASLRNLLAAGTIRTVSVQPHLARVQKATAVYEGDAWVSRTGSSAELRRAISLALVAHPAANR